MTWVCYIDCMNTLINMTQALYSIVPLPQDALTVLNELRERKAFLICASIPNYDVDANAKSSLPSVLSASRVQEGVRHGDDD